MTARCRARCGRCCPGPPSIAASEAGSGARGVVAGALSIVAQERLRTPLPDSIEELQLARQVPVARLVETFGRHVRGEAGEPPAVEEGRQGDVLVVERR